MGATACVLSGTGAEPGKWIAHHDLCGEGGVVFESYDVGTTYGAFVDYVIYDTTRDNMRAGTLYAVWNTGEAVYTDTSTVDIGDTSNAVLYAEIDGTNVNLIVNGSTSFTIKYNLKLIK